MKKVIMKTELLCKSFVSDGEVNNVLKNISLDIYENDFTVIMGSSGSGKSTLLYMLSGMDSVTSGKVYLNDKEITNMKEKDMAVIRRNSIGFVFQGINLVPDLTIAENIMSPTYKAKSNVSELEKRKDVLLDQMSLDDQKNKFPNQLSGGQKQRAAICRALINSPDVVFADEPTGALNSSQGQDVLDVFSDVNKNGQTVVMVTHDLKAALRGNRIIYLKDGRIDGDLSHDDYSSDDFETREKKVYEFLKKRGW